MRPSLWWLLENMTKTFVLLGDSPEKAAEEAHAVMTIETTLAKGSLDRVAMRDPATRYHPMSVAERMVLLDHLTRGRIKLGVGPGALATAGAEALPADGVAAELPPPPPPPHAARASEASRDNVNLALIFISIFVFGRLRSQSDWLCYAVSSFDLDVCRQRQFVESFQKST